MARGYPDFFGMSIFPFYGSPLVFSDAVLDILAGNTEAAIDLALKGQSGPGYVKIEQITDMSDVSVFLKLDGNTAPVASLDKLYNVQAGDRDALGYHGTYLNRKTGVCTIALLPAIPFAVSYQFYIVNGLATDLIAKISMNYYAVE